ncbi:MAG: hypothetical protein AAFZ05_10165, partial [Pseudomonadota bacterium]
VTLRRYIGGHQPHALIAAGDRLKHATTQSATEGRLLTARPGSRRCRYLRSIHSAEAATRR